jgi:hypothetical protein
MAASAATPLDGDYGNRADVLQIITPIISTYSTYLESLDSLQSDNGGNVENYIPDGNAIAALDDLVDYTLSNLFTIAIGAKQERSVILEDDSNVIILTHRFYGLDPDDANLDKFIRQNGIGISELPQIKKGRKIIYYV